MIDQTVIISEKEFKPERFKDIHENGRFQIEIWNKKCEVVKSFRCDTFTSAIVGDWIH